MLSIGTILQFIGLTSVVLTTYRILSNVSLWLPFNTTLKRYNRESRAWALVTGASAGIGRGLAEELTAKGFNVILSGHKRDELEETRDSIVARFPGAGVKILVLDAVHASPAEIETALVSVSDLQITVLINNVGGMQMMGAPRFRRLDQYSAEDLDGVVFLSARFMAHVTRLMIPLLAKNGPSLIINVSSGARMGMPGVAAYSATKGFVTSLTNAVAREMKADKLPIDVLGIVPGDVESQSNNGGLQPGSPSSKRFAKTVMDQVGRAASRGYLELCPWPFHVIQIAFFDSLPEWLRQKLVTDVFEKKKAVDGLKKD
ncbi:hypothetical protein CEP54_005960 [Fusarium duplospermum]|uniref:Uncharacterized protein n=1 Tax=Fusarium duplospermum TaxID=1325734 RepID=A0A428Q9D6_9HYPO|nr:hypothetical protein CEP54_005960 [Fusarium duplospermum]